MEIKTCELTKYLEVWYANSMANPTQTFVPMLESYPGIGKTAIVKQFAQSKGVNCKVLDLCLAQPSEVCGMMIPDDSSGTIKYYDPDWVGELKDGDILFLDEIKKAPQAVWNACLIMINERVMPSGTQLPAIAIIAACNPGKGVFTPEQKQRFRELEVTWDQIMWVDYVKDTLGVKPTAKLINLFEFPDYETASRTQWNFFTPRECYKDLLMAKTMADNDKTFEEVRDILYYTWTKQRVDELMDVARKFWSKGTKSEQREKLEQMIKDNFALIEGEFPIEYINDRSELSDYEFVNNLPKNVLNTLFPEMVAVEGV